MQKILISRCLLGHPVRFDAKSKPIADQRIAQWQTEDRLITICPEVAGGLSTPRPAAEIQPNGQVITQKGQNVTPAFQAGAQASLELAIKYNIKLALLKARSPSCGSRFTYNGQFTGQLIGRDGMTAALLKQHGIMVFDETEIDALTAQL